MKVRAKMMYFDGLKRQRPGSVFEISNEKWKAGDKIPNGKSVGDFKFFSPTYMEMVDETVPAVSLKRKLISSETLNQDVI